MRIIGLLCPRFSEKPLCGWAQAISTSMLLEQNKWTTRLQNSHTLLESYQEPSSESVCIATKRSVRSWRE